MNSDMFHWKLVQSHLEDKITGGETNSEHQRTAIQAQNLSREIADNFIVALSYRD